MVCYKTNWRCFSMLTVSIRSAEQFCFSATNQTSAVEEEKEQNPRKKGEEMKTWSSCAAALQSKMWMDSCGPTRELFHVHLRSFPVMQKKTRFLVLEIWNRFKVLNFKMRLSCTPLLLLFAGMLRIVLCSHSATIFIIWYIFI